MPIGFDDLVDDVMNDCAAAIPVFPDFKMGFIGCPIAGLDLAQFAFCTSGSLDSQATKQAEARNTGGLSRDSSDAG